jgi:hypothetical protein
VVASVLFVAVVILLATVLGALTMGIVEEERPEPQNVFVEDQCPGFQVVEFDPTDVDTATDRIRTDNCALWLEQGNVETTGSGTVETWHDEGKHGFDATQDDANAQAELVRDSDLGADVLEFDATQPDGASTRGDNDGQFLRLQRDIDDLDVDEDSGIVVAAVVKVDEFDRGGTWTIGKAGSAGEEYSMRTCSDRSVDGCQYADPEGRWRGQHWGATDVDFSSGDESAGEWITLVHAYDGDEVTVRVNGEVVARKAVDLDLSTDRDIQIGRWERTSGDPHWYFDGRIAEIVLFDETLETEEIDLIESYFHHEYGIELDGPVES